MIRSIAALFLATAVTLAAASSARAADGWDGTLSAEAQGQSNGASVTRSTRYTFDGTAEVETLSVDDQGRQTGHWRQIAHLDWHEQVVYPPTEPSYEGDPNGGCQRTETVDYTGSAITFVNVWPEYDPERPDPVRFTVHSSDHDDRPRYDPMAQIHVVITGCHNPSFDADFYTDTEPPPGQGGTIWAEPRTVQHGMDDWSEEVVALGQTEPDDKFGLVDDYDIDMQRDTCTEPGSDDDLDGDADVCDERECKVYASGIDACSLQPGDILVDRGSNTNGITLGITLGGDSYWTHAAMVLGYMNLDYDDPHPTPQDCVDVEPRFEGDDDPDCELVIAEAVPNEPQEIRIKDIEDTVWGDASTDNTDWNVVRLDDVPASTRAAAAKELSDHLLFGLGAILPQNHVNQNGCASCDKESWGASDGEYEVFSGARGPLKFYCSSLVWWAYDQVGVELDHNPLLHWPWDLLEPAFVTPDELVGKEETGPRYLRQPPPDGLVTAIFSPANLVLTDAQGRRTGKTPDGTVHHEIPGAIWWDNGESESISAKGASPSWKLSITGYDTGKYTLVSRRLDGTSERAAGFTRPGQVETVRLGDVSSLSDRPVAADDAADVGQAGATLDVLANDFGSSGASLTLSTPPSHGSATVTPGRQVRYVPASGYGGADRFVYRICRGGACTNGVVRLTVAAPPGGGGGPGGAGSGAPQPAARLLAKLSVARRASARKAVKLRIRCPARCRVKVAGRVKAGRQKLRSLRTVLRALAANKATVVRLRLPAAQRRAVGAALRRRQRASLAVTVTVTHADGTRQRLRRTVRLR